MGKDKPATKVCKHCKTEIPAGAKVCPQCRKKQGGVLKWVIIAIVVIGIIGAAAGGGDEPTEVSSTNSTTQKQQNNVIDTQKKEEETKEEITYTAYTVTQMMDDLKSNALKAESTYKDQYIEITGRLSNIDSSGKYISLHPEDDEWAIIGVQCYIKSEKQKEKVMEMSIDDIVTLKGKIKSVGEVLGYSLDIDEIN